jgi:hypothetical protein
MRTTVRWVSGCLVVIALCECGPAFAQAPPQVNDTQALRQDIAQLRKDFEALQKQYNDRLAALEAKLAASEGSAAAAATPASASAQPDQAAVPQGAQGAGGPVGALPVYGASSAASKIFNPDIAVIGDFLGAAGRNTVNPGKAFEMHESEASFQAVVDPYARADFFISFGEEGVELEEGYITFPALPGGLLVKAGKMRAAFGKVNTLHNHVLPWTDRPLVSSNLVNGEDGIDEAGFSVARLIPNPWFFLEATGQVFRGDSGDLFASSTRGDLSYVGHVRGYQDITEGTNIDIGGSYARGHNDAGLSAAGSGLLTQLYGVDATLRWRPLKRAIYHSFVGRSELVWSQRQQPLGEQHAFGYYVSGDYQLGRRWFAGARFDRSERATDSSLRDTGGSLLVTYVPSEFSQIRGQYRRIRFGDDAATANELLFQLQFAIGAHGAHPF